MGSFVFLETKEETIDDGAGGRTTVTKETMIFPRYHQLDSVRKLTNTAREEKAGNNYLIQHSAEAEKPTAYPGSRTGYRACIPLPTKKYSIAWL